MSHQRYANRGEARTTTDDEVGMLLDFYADVLHDDGDLLRIGRIADMLGDRPVSGLTRVALLDWGYCAGPVPVIRALDAPLRGMQIENWHDVQAARLDWLTKTCGRESDGVPTATRQRRLVEDCQRVATLSRFLRACERERDGAAA